MLLALFRTLTLAGLVGTTTLAALCAAQGLGGLALGVGSVALSLAHGLVVTERELARDGLCWPWRPRRLRLDRLRAQLAAELGDVAAVRYTTEGGIRRDDPDPDPARAPERPPRHRDG